MKDVETELRAANDHIQFLTQMGQEKQQQIESLENKVKKLTKLTNEQEVLIKELQSGDK